MLYRAWNEHFNSIVDIIFKFLNRTGWNRCVSWDIMFGGCNAVSIWIRKNIIIEWLSWNCIFHPLGWWDSYAAAVTVSINLNHDSLLQEKFLFIVTTPTLQVPVLKYAGVLYVTVIYVAQEFSHCVLVNYVWYYWVHTDINTFCSQNRFMYNLWDRDIVMNWIWVVLCRAVWG